MKRYQMPVSVMLLIVLAAVFLYLPGLSGGFFFDDLPSIISVQELQQNQGGLELLMEAWRGGAAGPLGRPIAQLSFALNHYFSGLDPYAFKATNLAIHLSTGIVVFFVALRFFADDDSSTKPRQLSLMALAVVGAWMLHPVHLLTVLHVVQRMTSLSALFLLLALLFHMLARDRTGFKQWMLLVIAWGGLWPLSIFSKETGLLFPLFVVAWELLLRRTKLGFIDRFGKSITFLVSAILAGALIYLLMPSGAWLLAGYEMRSFTLLERVLSEGRGIWFYISLFIYPRLEAFGLYHDDFLVSSSIVSPWTTLFSFIGILLVLLVIWVFRNKRPMVSFGLAWFLIGHLLESTVVPLELIHEHRNYLPLIGLVVALVSLLMSVVEGKGNWRALGVSMFGAFLVFSALTTYMRARQYENDLMRTQLEAQYHPSSSRAHYEAGSLLAQLPDAQSSVSPAYSFAAFHFNKAGELDPAQKMSWLGLIVLNCDARQPLKNEWLEQLSWRLANTPFAPGDRNVLYFLKELALAGRLCLTQEQVEYLFASAYRNKSVSAAVSAMLHSWHADYLWLVQSNMESALRHLEKSLSLNPGSDSTRLKLVQLHFINNDVDGFDRELVYLKSNRLSRDEQRLLDEMLSARNLAP